MTGHDIEAPKPALEDRLRWCYGAERASEIIAGRDEAANRDLASWERLGARSNAESYWTETARRIAQAALQDLRRETH